MTKILLFQETSHINDYLSVAGLMKLRQEIVSFHHTWDSVLLEEERLVVGPGSKELIYLSMVMFRGEILLPAPAWTTYSPQVRKKFDD